MISGPARYRTSRWERSPSEGPHKRNKVAGPVGLVLLTGPIVGHNASGPYSGHLHAAVADADGRMQGGHLFKATVGAVAEVGLSSVQDPRLKRTHDTERQIDVLEL